MLNREPMMLLPAYATVQHNLRWGLVAINTFNGSKRCVKYEIAVLDRHIFQVGYALLKGHCRLFGKILKKKI